MGLLGHKRGKVGRLWLQAIGEVQACAVFWWG